MKHPDSALIVFAKAPVPGQVKTRLLPAISVTEAAQLQEILIQRTLSAATRQPLCPVYLYCAPDTHHAFFAQCQRDYNVVLEQQTGHGLGERMSSAFENILSAHDRAVLIGTDCPALTSQHLDGALTHLSGENDAVFIPAEDGGYVLVGLCKNHRRMFTAIDWGTEQVMEQTRQRLRQQSLRWHEFRPLWDVDRPEDVERLAQLDPGEHQHML
jgi:rSAM/selenodomain-associated transferase 1